MKRARLQMQKQAKKGLVHSADEGNIILNEIGDMGLSLQSKF